MTDPSLSKARADLAAATAARDSQLCRWAPTIFDGETLDLFMASYMAMRHIDDQIDELAPADRHKASPGLGWVDEWQERVASAARGECEPSGLPIWQMLAARLPKAGYDATPFVALAEALRTDARGELLEDWVDFWRYCEGATVAPTAVYLDLMQDEWSQTGFSQIWDWARPLGRFCYLAHIMRDLKKDAAAGEHLLTLPFSIFKDLAASRGLLVSRLLAEDAVRQIITRRLLKKVPALIDELEMIMGDVMGRLTTSSRNVLGELLLHYGGIIKQQARFAGADEISIPHFFLGKAAPI